MWVLEECRREWDAQGERTSHDEIFRAAREAASLGFCVELNAPEFATRGDMVRKLGDACRAQGSAAPITRGELVRLILESIAASHAEALNQLDAVTGRRTQIVHVVGGGALNDLLNQMTADRSGRRVLAGPDEATVLGNLLVQARALGDLPAGVTVRDAARRSSRIREFTSRHATPVEGSATFAL
jgi:rhamnulokinase